MFPTISDLITMEVDYDQLIEDHRKKRHLRMWIIIMVFLLLTAVVTLTRITDITVKGNQTYTAEQAEELVFPKAIDRNTIYCFIKDRFFPHKTLPFLSGYDIQFTSPFACDLVIYEKSVVCCLQYMSSYMYFDKDGIVVENTSSKIIDVPEIKGLKFSNITINKKLPLEEQDIFTRIMTITEQLNTYNISCSAIDLSDTQSIVLYINGGDIMVELGNDTELAAKITALSDMLPEIESRELKGTLDLSNYSDQNKSNVNSFRVRENSGTGDADTDIVSDTIAEQ